MMVSIKEAVANAIDFAGATLGPERTNGIRLEEVESVTSAGEGAWFITLSMIDLDAQLDKVIGLLKGKRDYKSFTVLKSTGEVTSMKIRELADA